MKTKPMTKTEGFSAEEKAAMKARIKELKAEQTKAGGEKDVLAAIAAMPEPDHSMGARLHALIKANARSLSPKTWYGMPAYANAEGKVVIFFRGSDKFKERYMTLGFNQEAKLDEGSLWPIAFALTAMSTKEESAIAALVKRAAG